MQGAIQVLGSALLNDVSCRPVELR